MTKAKVLGVIALLGSFTLGIAGESAAQVSWSKKINGKARFKVLPQFNREAVMDLNQNHSQVAAYSKTVLMSTGSYSSQIKTVTGPRT